MIDAGGRTASFDAFREPDVSETSPRDPSGGLRLAATWIRRRRSSIRIALFVVVGAVLVAEIVAVGPSVADSAVDIAHLRWAWVAVALVAEIGSMMAFARVQRRMLAAGGVRLPLRRAVAVTFAANAMSVTLPAGPAVSIGYVFRRMRAWGASSPVVAWCLVASGAVSTLALTAIGVLGAGLAGSESGSSLDSAGGVILIAVEVLAVAALAITVVVLVRQPELIVKLSDSATRRLDRLLRRARRDSEADSDGDSVQQRVSGLVSSLATIRPRPRDWLLGTWLAAANWLLDLVCLVAACRAVGAHGPTLTVALVAYAGGMVAASVPVLPGGLGLVDGALLAALTRGGVPLASATAGVLVYRLISLVMVAAIGWGFWFVLRSRDRAQQVTGGSG